MSEEVSKHLNSLNVSTRPPQRMGKTFHGGKYWVNGKAIPLTIDYMSSGDLEKEQHRLFLQRRKFDRLRAKQQAAAEREASVRHEYDRATQRSVFRSIQRALAGRWDGKMVRVQAP